MKLFRLKFLFSFFFVFLIFACASTAKACVPVGGTPPPCYVYWEADAVFAGEATDMTKVSRQQGETFDNLLVRFVVLEAFRGTTEKEIEVATITGTECDVKLAIGEKWLVYAYRNTKTGRFQMGMRTTLFSSAEEDLQYIRSLSAGLSQSSITVRVFQYPYTPLPGMKVEIRGKGVKYDGVTDDEGTFRVPAVKEGKYLVRGIFQVGAAVTLNGAATPPKNVEESSRRTMIEFEEDIDPGHCAYIQVFVYPPRQKNRL
jgi:hypothetical protein